jgi:hypothetical protein
MHAVIGANPFGVEKGQIAIKNYTEGIFFKRRLNLSQ